jgi:hypothetical protein
MTPRHTVQYTSALSRLQRVAIALNLGLGITYVILWVNYATQDMFLKGDFPSFYTGYCIVRDGLGSQLYDMALQARYQQQIRGGGDFIPFNYPPHTALVFALLAWAPVSYAFWIWIFAQGILLIWLFYLLHQLARDWHPHERWLLLTATFAFPPLYFNFLSAHFSLWLLVCLLQLYVTLKQGRESLAGLWFVLGTFKPQAVLLVGLSLLAARRWRAVCSAVLIGGCLAVFSGLVFGWECWVGFLRAVRFSASCFGIFGIHPTSMYNFKGALTLALGNDQGFLINWMSAAALIAAILLIFAVWRGPWQPNIPSFELRMALTLLLGLLFSPHLTQPDALILIAPATLFYLYLRKCQLPSLSFVTFALGCQMIFLLAESTIGGRLGIRIPTLALIIFTIWVGLALINERRKNLIRVGPDERL